MIKVKIGTEEKVLEDVTAGWLKEKINRRRLNGDLVCAQISIVEPPLNMILSTNGCPSSDSRSRAPKPAEQRIFDLWARLKLNMPEFDIGQLIAFLRQVQN